MSIKYKVLYKTIIILSSVFVIGGLILPVFPSAYSGQAVFAQTDEQITKKNIEMPEDFEEAKGIGMKIIKSMPDAARDGWEEAKEIWQNTWVKWWHNDIKPWFRAMWYERAKPFADKTINKVRILLGQEIEKRTPILKEEFEKEKQELREELKEEAPQISKGLWERFKELIR